MSKTLCEIFAPKDHVYVDKQTGFDFLACSSRLEMAFRKFHHLNPHVYDELVEMAFKLKSKGAERYGIKSLFEVIRWHKALETNDDEFKLNNNHAPYYARMIMNNYPELKDFFQLRVLKYRSNL